VPAFKFTVWKKGVIEKLPAPPSPFGLAVTAPVTDEALKELAGLKNLTYLDLANAKVTDDGLKCLTGLKKLKVLRVAGSKVTIEGAIQFRKAVPGCEVSLR
jgi:hypothetical protein